MEVLTPSISPHRSALDPHGTLPWLVLEPEARLFNQVYFGGFSAAGERLCDVHLSYNSPFAVNAAHVSWVQRLDSATPERPKGVGLAAHILLVEHLAQQNLTLVSDPYFMSDSGIAMWQRMVKAGVARQTNRVFRLPHTQPHFAVLAAEKIRPRLSTTY